jgi:hypothetical protein
MYLNYEEVEGIKLTDISDDDARELLQAKYRHDEAKRLLKSGVLTPSQVETQKARVDVYAKMRNGRDFLATFHEDGEAMIMAPFDVTVTVSPFWCMPVMRAELFKRIFDNPPVTGTHLHSIEEL